MNRSVYYQLLYVGFNYEKGRVYTSYFKIGYRKILKDEIAFWQRVLELIVNNEQDKKCVLYDMTKLCQKYDLPNYSLLLQETEWLDDKSCEFSCYSEQENCIIDLMDILLKDLDSTLNHLRKRKETVYLLRALHNLPRAFCTYQKLKISFEDAIKYAMDNMTFEMREKYKGDVLT